MKPQSNLAGSTLKFVLVDLIGDVLYWPVWWYSKGLIKVGLFCINELADQEERLGVSIWVKNIFVPMFGQYDWQGRLISFFMRLIQIIVRMVFLLVWAVVLFVVFLLWLVLPIYIGYQVTVNFISLF